MTNALTPSCNPGTPHFPATSLKMFRESRKVANVLEFAIVDFSSLDELLGNFNLIASNFLRIVIDIQRHNKVD